MLKIKIIVSFFILFGIFFILFERDTSASTPAIMPSHTQTISFKPVKSVHARVQLESTPSLSETEVQTKPTTTIIPVGQGPLGSANHPSSTFENLSSQQFMLNAINNYRASLGLYAVESNAATCNFAAIRAQEILSGFNHDGFQNRINNHTLPYSTYRSVTENIAETSNYQDVVNLWINSPPHAENMRADTPYVCVAQNGNYFAYEGWKP